MTDLNIQSGDYLFIGGTGRSGTTILSKIFSSHPLIADVPELRFLIDPDGILDFYSSSDIWSPYHFNTRLRRLNKLLSMTGKPNRFNLLWKAMQRMRLLDKLPTTLRPPYSDINVTKVCPEFQSLCLNLITQLETYHYNGSWVGATQFSKQKISYSYFSDKKKLAKILADFLLSFMHKVTLEQKASFYLEKNTWNILWFDKIIELLPGAKLVHIYRDPRDVVSSYTKQTWMPSDPIQSATIYCDLMDKWWNIRNKIPKQSYLEISLESLVANPKNILSTICQFWSVPWDDSLLSIPLTQSHTGRWKNDLSQTQQVKVQQTLEKPLQQYGYA